MFRHLKAFVETAKQGSVTQAAETLLLTQPTVSGQLRELEEELGVTLFHRLPRGVELSEAGVRFLPRAKEILESRTRLLDEASEYNGLLRGNLEIHASNIPGEYLMPICVTEFKIQHPTLKISCRIHDSKETLEHISKGEAYIGIVGGKDDNPDLEYFPLWEDCLSFYVAADHECSSKITLEELSAMPIILREEGSASRKTSLAALAGEGLAFSDLNILTELGSTTAVKKALTLGIAGAFLSNIAADTEVAAGTLREVSLEGLAPIERRFYLVRNLKRELSPSARAFSEFALKKSAQCFARASAQG